MTDIEIDIDRASEDSPSSSSSGGGGGGRRTNVMVQGKYGTEVYPPSTSCDECGARAVGILLIDRTRRRMEKISPGTPLCSTHRNEYRDDVADWDEWEFRRFVD